jgi:PKHD-type hydroxylase
LLVHVPEVLKGDRLLECRRIVEDAPWVDGRVTAGHQSMRVKDNEQIPEDHPAARKAGAIVLEALKRNGLFVSAALPLKVFPPLFNRYQGGETFGNHVDNAIRQVTGTAHRVRTDLSATVFLSRPDEYDGGELVVEDTYGPHAIKLAAGDMILYPGTSVHHVRAVTRGVRLASFFWIQSMVRDDGQRTLLFDLDRSIMNLTQQIPDSESVVTLTAVYHNLLRMWADS